MPTTRRQIITSSLGLFGAAVLAPRRSAAAPGGAVPKEFKVGFQKGAAILVLGREQQVIEKRLKGLGVDNVQWVEFQFGPPMLEALGAGAIDIGSVGDTPPIFAQAAGSPLVYAASTPSAEHAVLVPQDSPIKTLAELRGKRVAFGRGSSAHNVLVKALALAGLSLKDIVPTALAPADATAAFNGGTIDAWVVWDPYYAIAEARYNARVIADTSDKRLASASYYMSSRDFADKYPAVLSAALDEIGKLTEWSGQHRDELAKLAASVTSIDEKSWQIAFARAGFTFGSVTPAQIDQQQRLADTFYDLGIVPKKVTVADIVWYPPKS